VYQRPVSPLEILVCTDMGNTNVTNGQFDYFFISVANMK